MSRECGAGGDALAASFFPPGVFDPHGDEKVAGGGGDLGLGRGADELGHDDGREDPEDHDHDEDLDERERSAGSGSVVRVRRSHDAVCIGWACAGVHSERVGREFSVVTDGATGMIGG